MNAIKHSQTKSQVHWNCHSNLLLGVLLHLLLLLALVVDEVDLVDVQLDAAVLVDKRNLILT